MYVYIYNMDRSIMDEQVNKSGLIQRLFFDANRVEN